MRVILSLYLERHNEMGCQVDAKDKEAFDTAHRQLWSDCDGDLLERLAGLEATSKPTQKEIDEISQLKSYLPYDI